LSILNIRTVFLKIHPSQLTYKRQLHNVKPIS